MTPPPPPSLLARQRAPSVPAFLLALLLGVMLLVAGGCGASVQSPTAQVTATARPTATATVPPTPTVTLQPIHIQVPPHCSPVAASTFPMGTYANANDKTDLLKFQTNGELVHDVNLVVCFLVVQKHLIIVDTVECQDTATEYGYYTWSFDGKVLQFQYLRDHCYKRAASVIAQGWIKQA